MQPTYKSPSNSQQGFTLVELIMVIVIMGIVGGMVAVFMRAPIDAYISSGRRAALTDVADTTVRRIARDLRRALPNSIRTSGTSCLEFIPTKTGGRYRVQEKTALAGDNLDFSIADTTFNMLASNSALPASQQIRANDLIVVYNLGIVGADAYATVAGGRTWTTVSAAPSEPGTYTPAETVIPITAFKFPLPSGSNRFQVVDGTEQMVSYVCTGSNLLRVTSTALTAVASCPTSTGGAATASVIATNVDCSATSTKFTYENSDLQRNALITMILSISDSSGTESVSLHHEVHVDNTP